MAFDLLDELIHPFDKGVYLKADGEEKDEECHKNGAKHKIQHNIKINYKSIGWDIFLHCRTALNYFPVSFTVLVAQLVEYQIVVLGVVGSSPIWHPIFSCLDKPSIQNVFSSNEP